MAYSESLLFLLMVLAMYGMRAGWPRLLVAVIIGAATAARPVGLALVAPFLWTLWSDWKEREKAPSPGQRGQRGPAPLVQAAALVAISVWGLAAFMAWQGATFGDPLAFVRAQNYWAVRQANTALRELSSLASLSAMADVYVPDSPVYWRRFDSDLPAWLSLQFANPIYFAAAVALSLWGWFRGWLDDREALLATFLLLIPYVTHGFECGLAGHGRYATVAFPAHLALARALQSAAPLARWALYGVFTGLLFAYSALFACGYRLV